MDSTTDIKKRVVRGANLKYGPVPLYVNEWDGEMWATNRYWLTRASRVAPLLEKFNLSAAEPGGYEVNGTVRRATGQERDCSPVPPDIARFAGSGDLSLKTYKPGIRVHVAGMPAFVQPDDRSPWYAVYQTEDGGHVGLIDEELTWLSQVSDVTPPDGCRLGSVRVLFKRPRTGGVSAMVQAECFRVIEPGRLNDERTGYIPAVEEPAEPVLLALTMAMNFSG